MRAKLFPQSVVRKSVYLVFLNFLAICPAPAQQQTRTQAGFTRADTLRGMLTPLRTCYDVRFYHLDVRIDPDQQSVRGSNIMTFSVVTPFDRMQIDLFKNMDLDSIVLDGKQRLNFTREENAVFVKTGSALREGSVHSVQVFYGGKPIAAKRPPWEGGFIWTRDSTGNPWVAVTCQGTGASLWWPNKDHQSDKPDSMLISVTVPHDLTDISNGRLRDSSILPDGWKRFNWFVSYPINNYNVTVNIGTFSHFSDRYTGQDTITLDYYVLPQNLGKAREQFTQVKSMLEAYEHYFGPYPFSRDGYKLIESPHNGMEHQSAVAYGNHFLMGYLGRSSSPIGLRFDFIIIHESAHEWWGNSVTSKDIADMWIHESFGAYAEALYVEYAFGRQASLTYINGKKPNVRNTSPIIGVYNVQNQGSGDMYDKGQLVLNTLRSVINNDSLWFASLRALQGRYRYQTVTEADVVRTIDSITGGSYASFFDQYLKFSTIPLLEFVVTTKGEREYARYRWKADVSGFRMPVKMVFGEGEPRLISPTQEWQEMDLHDVDPNAIRVDDSEYYVGLKLSSHYLDSRVESIPGRPE